VGKFGSRKEEKTKSEDVTMDMQEFKLRRLIRKAIKIKERKQKQQTLSEERKLRKAIRMILAEGDVDADTNPAPYSSTPMNILATALDQVLPVLKTGLRGMTKPEERASYRAHVLEKITNIFNTVNSLGTPSMAVAKVGESDVGLFEQEDEEDIEVTVHEKPPEMVVPDSEKERFEPKKLSKKQQEEEQFKKFAISGENPTGARIAFETISSSNIQTELIDGWKILHDAKDKVEFEEFAKYNTDLWLIIYEDEIADELGQKAAFTETIIPKPGSAEMTAKGAEAEGGSEVAAGGEDIDALMKGLPVV
jgi:hypothetical protein